jgi:hypothetical protein
MKIPVLSTIAKAIVAAVTAGYALYNVVASDGSVTSDEWVKVLVATVIAFTVTWAVPNSTPDSTGDGSGSGSDSPNPGPTV